MGYKNFQTPNYTCKPWITLFVHLCLSFACVGAVCLPQPCSPFSGSGSVCVCVGACMRECERAGRLEGVAPGKFSHWALAQGKAAGFDEAK